MSQEKRYDLRAAFLLSVPTILATVIEPLAAIVDTALVGHKSSLWLASIALTAGIFSAFIWVFNFLVHGITAQVAASLGEDSQRDANDYIKLAIYCSFFLGLLASVAVWFLKDPIFHFMGADEELQKTASGYYFYRCVGLSFSILFTAITGVLRGLQRIGYSLWLAALFTGLNISFTYSFLYPLNLDIEWAGIGTSSAYFIGCGVGLGMVLKLRSFEEFKILERIRFNLNRLKAFFIDGLNYMIRTAFLASSFFLATTAASQIGKLSLAAHQIGFEIWIFSAFFIDGFAITANFLGAKLLGSKEVAQAWRVFRSCLFLGIGTGGAMCVLYYLLETPIISIFSDDPRIHQLLAQTWWVLCLSQIPNAIVYVFDGIILAHRDFRFAKFQLSFSFLAIYVPLLLASIFYFESLEWVWISLTFLNLSRAGLAIWRYSPTMKTARPESL